MNVQLVDIKDVTSFKEGWELVEYEAGTDPLDGFSILGFDEIGSFATNPLYAFVQERKYECTISRHQRCDYGF